MNIIAVTNSDDTITLTKPLYVCIRKSDDAAAHSLSCNFGITEQLPPLKEITVKYEDIILFSGVVDTQTVSCDDKGMYLSINARSYAALLLDSEAMPTNYYMPSLQLIYDRHLAPYGIKGFKGENKVFTSQMNISKGCSEWSVIKKFADTFMGINPIIDENGYVDLTGNDSNNTVFVYYDDKIINISKVLNPYKLISQVILRTEENADYSMTVNNNKPTPYIKRRYYDGANTALSPLYKGEKIIDNSNMEYLSVKIKYSGFLPIKINNKMKILNSPISLDDTLVVKEIKYTLSSKGKYTDITLGFLNEVINNVDS